MMMRIRLMQAMMFALSTLLAATAVAADTTVTTSNDGYAVTALDPQPAICPGGEPGTRFAYTCTGGDSDHAYLSFLASAEVCDAQPQPVSFSHDGNGDSKTGYGRGHPSRTIVRFNPAALNCSFELTVVGTVGPTLGDVALSKGKLFEWAAVPVPQGDVANPFEAKTESKIEKWKDCTFEMVRDIVTGEVLEVNMIAGNCVTDTVAQSAFAIQKLDANGDPIGPPQANLFTPQNTSVTVGGETGSTYYLFDGVRWIRVTDCADPTDPRPPCP